MGKQPTDAQLDTAAENRDGELPQHLRENSSDATLPDSTSLTPEDLYGKPGAGDANPGKNADQAGKSGGSEARPDDGPKPEDEPEPPTPNAGDQTKGNARKDEWDKARQAKDEEIAELRKQVQDLKAQPNAPAKPDDDRGQEAAEPLDAEELANPIDQLDPDLDTDPESMAKVVNKLVQRDNARVAAEAQDGNREAYNKILDKACKLEGVGEGNRNKIVTEMARLFDKRGYGPGKFPSADQTEDAVMSLARCIQADSLRARLEATTKPRSEPSLQDGARSGAPADVESAFGSGSLDEEADKMVQAGDFKWAGVT